MLKKTLAFLALSTWIVVIVYFAVPMMFSYPPKQQVHDAQVCLITVGRLLGDEKLDFSWTGIIAHRAPGIDGKMHRTLWLLGQSGNGTAYDVIECSYVGDVLRVDHSAQGIRE